MFKKFTLYLIHKPGLILSLSFALIILTGTILLSLPWATVSGGISAIDALFTAVSAVCVTGLIVQDTAAYFTRFGHTVILVLMQIGALGIMSGAAVFHIMLRKKMRIAYQATLRRTLDTEFIGEAVSLVKFIIISVFLLEFIGALFLFFYWRLPFLDYSDKIFYSVFHSISAFGNAGFSLFSDSFQSFTGALGFNIIIASLIVLGGLGFMVLADIKDVVWNFFRRKEGIGKFHLHTKITLAAVVFLIVLGAVCLLVFEKGNPEFAANPLIASYFQSITTRTAGFSTVDISSLSAPSYLMFMAFMFIGGGAGSTAGGVKIATVIIFLILIFSFIRNRREVAILGRALPLSNIKRAATIFVFSLAILIIFSTVLLYTEEGAFHEIIFEAVSAFGTVGLSTGLTPHLTFAGKILIILLMFIGRIGPLTIALITAREAEDSLIKYPHERIIVG